jgi:ubiquitin C-terminal hydrolase
MLLVAGKKVDLLVLKINKYISCFNINAIIRGATCYLNSLVQSMYMTPEMRYSLFKLDFEEENLNAKESIKQNLSLNDTTSYEEEPYFSQLLEFGFAKSLVRKCFEKFYTLNKTLDIREQEKMLEWLFEQPPVDDSLEDSKPVELKPVESKQKKKRATIPYVLQHMFAFMSSIDKPAIGTGQLTESFGWESKHVVVQHDVQELNRVLFQALERALKDTSEKDLIKRLYRGTMVNKITCQECHKVSETQEEFDDIPLVITQSVQQSLREYCTVEVMQDANAYFCDRCGKRVTAHRCSSLKTLPPLLHFSLLRFTYDNQNGRKKVSTKMSFPIIRDLDMGPFMENGSGTYELFAVIIHNGSAYSGHYHCIIRDTLNEGKHEPPIVNTQRKIDTATSMESSISKELINGEKKTKNKKQESDNDERDLVDDIRWFNFNDEHVLPVTSVDIQKYFGGKTESAYMLVYRRKDFAPATPTNIPKYLAQEIQQENDKIKTRREEIEREKFAEEQKKLAKQSHVHVYTPTALEIISGGVLRVLSSEKKHGYKYVTVDEGINMEGFQQLLREKFSYLEGDIELYELKNISRTDQTYTVGDPIPIITEEQLYQSMEKSNISDESTILVYPIESVLPFHMEAPTTANITLHLINSATIIPLELDLTNEPSTLPVDGNLYNADQLITGPRNLVLFANRDIFVSNSGDVAAYRKKLPNDILITTDFGILRLNENTSWDEFKQKLTERFGNSEFRIEKRVGDEFIKVTRMNDIHSGDFIHCVEKENEINTKDWSFVEMIYENPFENEYNIGERFTLTLDQRLKLKPLKNKLSQLYKNRNSFYASIYDFRFRFSRNKREPATLLFTEEDKTMNDLLQNQIDCQYDPLILYIELGQPPLEGLIRVNLHLLVNWPPSNPLQITEKYEHLIQVANITVSSNWTLATVRARIHEYVPAFKQVQKPQLLRLRECVSDFGYIRPIRIFTERFHMHKTLEKLHWSKDKDLAIQILNQEDNFDEQETGEQVKPTPPPVILIVRRYNNGTFEPGVEIPFPQNDRKIWSDIKHFRKFIATHLGLENKSIFVAKYIIQDDLLNEIEEVIPNDQTEQPKKKKKRQQASTISKRYSLLDGDILIIADKIDHQLKTYWRTVKEQKRREIEQRKAKEVHSNDIEQYDRKYETEVPLQIFMD